MFSVQRLGNNSRLQLICFLSLVKVAYKSKSRSQLQIIPNKGRTKNTVHRAEHTVVNQFDSVFLILISRNLLLYVFILIMHDIFMLPSEVSKSTTKRNENFESNSTVCGSTHFSKNNTIKTAYTFGSLQFWYCLGNWYVQKNSNNSD